MMKRYLVNITPDMEKWAPRKRDLDEGKRKHNWEPGENGRVLIWGEYTAGGAFGVIECEDPEDFTKDISAIAEIEFRELVLCPVDCTWCPNPVVEPLKGTHTRGN